MLNLGGRSMVPEHQLNSSYLGLLAIGSGLLLERLSPEIFRFLATFSGLVAREGEFPGDEVEHGGHVFHRPVPASLTLHG